MFSFKTCPSSLPDLSWNDFGAKMETLISPDPMAGGSVESPEISPPIVISQSLKESGSHMKITIDIDITPEELRSFLGLPNVEKLQQQMLDRAQEYLKDAGQSQYADMVSGAMQPLFAYQNWVQRMLTGTDAKPADKDQKGDASGE